MKKTLVFCLIAISYFSASSQTIEIDDYTWYVHSYEINGNTTDKPFSPEMTIQLDFDLSNNILMSDLCCGGSFQLDINVDANNSTFQGSNFTNTATNCTETGNTSFVDFIHYFFENSENETINYNINTQNTFPAILELNNTSGETIILHNSPHENSGSFGELFNDNAYWGKMTDFWYLESMNINNNYYSPADISNAFGNNAKASFSYYGELSFFACNTLTANFTSLQNINNNFFINCNNLTYGTDQCSSTNATTLENLYFGFLIEQAQNEKIMSLQYTFDVENPQTFGIYDTSSENYLFFSSDPLLSADGFSYENDINVYPNPAKETVFIENNHQQINQIQVIDISGKQLKTFKNLKNQVDVSELPSGVYFFKIYSEGNTTIKKVIIE